MRQEARDLERGTRARAGLGRGHACARSCCARQVVLLRRRRAARSSPTGSSAASRSSRATRSARRRRFRGADRARSSTSRTSATGGSRCSARPSAASTCTARHGLHALYHGDEAVVETAAFSLEGRAIRKVRQSVHRLEEAGSSARRAASERDRRRVCDAELTDDRRLVAWRTARARVRDGARRALLRSATRTPSSWSASTPAGRRAAASCTSPCRAAISALSLSSMPRVRASTPNGFNEWLICEAIAWARRAGLRARVAELLAVRGAPRRRRRS